MNSRERAVTDLQELADRGTHQWRQLKEKEARSQLSRRRRLPSAMIKFAYEAIAWAPHVNTWEDAFKIVRDVNRTNFGACLDTFQIAASVFVDPGRFPHGIQPRGEQRMRESMQRIEELLTVLIKCFTYKSQTERDFRSVCLRSLTVPCSGGAWTPNCSGRGMRGFSLSKKNLVVSYP